MIKSKNRIDYITVLKYLAVFLLFMLFSFVENTQAVYSVSFLAVILEFNLSLIFTPILFLASFLVTGETGLLLSVIFPAIILPSVNYIYRRFKYKPTFETALFCALSTIGFVVFGNTNYQIDFEKKMAIAVFTFLLTPILKCSFSALINKRLKFKFSYEEYASSALVGVLLAIAVCNLFSPIVLKAISFGVILFSAFSIKKSSCILISSIFGISFSIYYGNLNLLSCYVLLSLVALITMPSNRFLSALTVAFFDYACYAILQIYPSYGIIEFSAVAFGGLTFLLIPNKKLNGFKERLLLFKERQLVRQAINRNRINVSNRLYELSNVFSEMQDAFYTLTKKEEDFPSVKDKIQAKTVSSVCLNCLNKEKCKQKNNPNKADLDKIIDIGFAKGKISFVDLPSSLLETCVHPNDLMFCINKCLMEHRNKKIDESSQSKRLELIAGQSGGVSEILRTLALETGTLLKYHNKLERELTENLFKKGFIVSELLIYGEECSISVGLIVEMREFDLSSLIATVEKTLKIKVYLQDKVDVTTSRVYLSLKKAPIYDAIFGLSTTKKEGSIVSGDAHSVIRLKGDKFLVALSDGMGSGEKAESVSSVCLSLIESFYKAGLKSKLILDTVNKLLAINTEDSFTALDVTVIDLNDLSADFIKYGSPYGFIVSNNQVKIIEGNTLPLGIIEDLSPAVCKTKLSDGDIILLLSDGISDAFKSSGEIIDYLRTAPAFNPQTLTEDILSKALQKLNGEKRDDMTALAVRIFKSENLPQ